MPSKPNLDDWMLPDLHTPYTGNLGWVLAEIWDCQEIFINNSPIYLIWHGLPKFNSVFPDTLTPIPDWSIIPNPSSVIFHLSFI